MTIKNNSTKNPVKIIVQITPIIILLMVSFQLKLGIIGDRLDIYGNVVPQNSPQAHWPIKEDLTK